MTDVVRIGNASGFYGDRFSAVQEMLTGGELDYLTGDYLAELTMLILGRDRMKDSSLGYAKTFLHQMRENLALALDRQVRIVVNAGGLNPHGLAVALRELASELGVDAGIAFVSGDDLAPRAAELGLGAPLTANAYLGAFGIKSALDRGADIVVTGRVTDASLTVGPAAAAFDWTERDLHPIAGAVIAGHVIECGAQATGGNYSFFTEIPMGHLGFPIAELHSDGSSVITKHDGTGGEVSIGTVTSQLLYEVRGPRYYNPDATARLDSVQLTQRGPDRVAISAATGEAPPTDLKVSLNQLAGLRNEVDVVLTGLDIEAKATLFQEQFTAALPEVPAELEWTLVRHDRPDADTEEQASAILRCVARDTDPKKVGRAFANTAVQLALATYPGFTLTAPPGNGSPYGVFEPGYVDAGLVEHRVTQVDGRTVLIPPSALRATPMIDNDDPAPVSATDWGPTRRLPLGAVAGARSGDKGGSANIGLWARSDAAYRWLDQFLSTERLVELLPEADGLEIHRYRLPNLRAVNFVIEGILGRGVAENVRFDPQAKGLGEWLRSRHVEIPEQLLH
ncbi:MAG: acyclic terpene utilization AtuA family protein [Gordonia sp. (in: high G+C Gram-positive bacteria)]|uniref:acyclic terpene utilization AtuA family protein n=1 Tax=Gordonia sp. (in: high G+C Gram-positive bacteria) TaxID=84139 RepID=UPI003BB70780